MVVDENDLHHRGGPLLLPSSSLYAQKWLEPRFTVSNDMRENCIPALSLLFSLFNISLVIHGSYCALVGLIKLPLNKLQSLSAFLDPLCADVQHL